MRTFDRRSPVSDLWVCQLGLVPYREAVELQEQLRGRRLAGAIPDVLLLLEHPPVYTRGRRSGADDLPFGEDFYRSEGIELAATDRGGKLTYHGPGQLVGYPIMAIADIAAYLRTMEGAIIHALAEQQIRARSRREEGIDYTGVWVADRKIASIGLHVSRGVTTHGFAINVQNDLEPFSRIIACGLPDVRMTSIAAERGAAAAAAAPGVACFRKEMAYRFCLAHGRRQRLVTARRLGIAAAHAGGGAPPGAQPIQTIAETALQEALA